MLCDGVLIMAWIGFKRGRERYTVCVTDSFDFLKNFECNKKIVDSVAASAVLAENKLFSTLP